MLGIVAALLNFPCVVHIVIHSRSSTEVTILCNLSTTLGSSGTNSAYTQNTSEYSSVSHDTILFSISSLLSHSSHIFLITDASSNIHDFITIFLTLSWIVSWI